MKGKFNMSARGTWGNHIPWCVGVGLFITGLRASNPIPAHSLSGPASMLFGEQVSGGNAWNGLESLQALINVQH